MSKKKDQAEEATEGPPEEVVAVEEEATAPAHWTETVWGTMARWACAYCPFDSLDGEAAMAEHYRAEHAPPPPPAPVVAIQVYDRWGNPV